MRDQYNFETIASDIEAVDDSDCRVVPNMALSVKDILRRFNNGTLPENIDRNYYDYDDEDLDKPVIEFKDLTDLTEMSENSQQVLKKVHEEAQGNTTKK